MATILAFPSRPRDEQRLALIGQHLRDSYTLPSRDRELALLMEMAQSLVQNITDDGCDRFLNRLDAWEAANQKS